LIPAHLSRLGHTGAYGLFTGTDRPDAEGSATAARTVFLAPALRPLRSASLCRQRLDFWQFYSAALERGAWRPLTCTFILIFIPLACGTQFELIVRPHLDCASNDICPPLAAADPLYIHPLPYCLHARNTPNYLEAGFSQ
jgi:hypothetical protein